LIYSTPGAHSVVGMDIILIIAGVGYILARRLLGELLEAKRLLIVPVVLTVIGAGQLAHIKAVNATTVSFIVVGCLISVGIGLVRGRTVHLGERDGVLWMRYTVGTLLLWVLNLAAKVALWPFEHAVSPSATSAANHGLLLSIGLGVVAESLMVLYRAMHTEATVVWAKGKDGRPNQTPPAFERARTWVQSGPARDQLIKRDW